MFKAAFTLAVATLAVGADLAVAGTAHADAASYLAWLQNHGVSDPLANGASLISTGTAECDALRHGKPEHFLIGQLESQVGRAESDDVVFAAHHFLCPDA